MDTDTYICQMCGETVEILNQPSHVIDNHLPKPYRAGMIDFPKWVGEPTPCKTRTFSLVVPKCTRYKSTQHGAIRMTTVFKNRPTVFRPRRGLPGFYTDWA